jgi:hypothetical protein
MHMMKPSALRENFCVPLGRFFSEKLLAPISALAGSGRGAILRLLGPTAWWCRCAAAATMCRATRSVTAG